MDIWIHIKNTHEPLFFRSIINNLDNCNIQVTSRNIFEVVKLLDKYNYDYSVNDSHFGNSILSKSFGQIIRTLRIMISIEKFDIAISHGCSSSTFVAKLFGLPSISITDNDMFTTDNRT